MCERRKFAKSNIRREYRRSALPLLPGPETGEVAGPGPQVVQAGVLLGGAAPGVGPGPSLAGHVGGESRADDWSAGRDSNIDWLKQGRKGSTAEVEKCIDLSQTNSLIAVYAVNT